MIDRDHKPSITRQASLLNLSRGAVYYLPKPVSPADLALMRRLDEPHLEHPVRGAPGHKVHPSLLRKLAITRANPVWALDTTDLPLARGFVSLSAAVDVASCRVLAHPVAITPQAVHARDVIEPAFARSGVPEIVNTDQGNPFTVIEFTAAILARGGRLSMDGRGAGRDNVLAPGAQRQLRTRLPEGLRWCGRGPHGHR